MGAFAAERGVRHRTKYLNFAMRPILRYSVNVLLIGGALVLTGCPQVADVWILPTSTDTRLAFGIGNESDHAKPVAVQTFTVTPCAERRLTRSSSSTRRERDERRSWEIEYISGPDSIAWLRYGEAPSNYRVLTPPTPITSGDCYIADFYGRNGYGSVNFRVTTDHRIIAVRGLKQ